ncbi:MAG: chorismate-binding protein [Candidatus Marsarchaeota archaeon]|nr:chorismate-binding protein [Candidatus Marsarchaeota archaeon]
MAKCTKCGAEVYAPIKTWDMRGGKIGMYLCPVCGTRFKASPK